MNGFSTLAIFGTKNFTDKRSTYQPVVLAAAGTVVLHRLVFAGLSGVVSNWFLVWTNFYLLDSFAVEADALKNKSIK